MKTRNLSLSVWGILLASMCVASGDEIFSFAGFTFNQANTPNQAVRLGNSTNLGGANFSSSLPDSATASVNFPQGGPGFNNALSLGLLTGLHTNGVRAVNLPKGNVGTTIRHGIQVSWSGGQGIPNLAGPDFVIYESGTTSNTVEGVMARVRINPQTDTWSDWFYFPPDNHQNFLHIAEPAEVAFSYGFDLSDMNVPTNALIDRIQLANLIQADRIQTTNATDIGNGVLVGQGKVVFDGSSNVLPDAGGFDDTRLFEIGAFDPDPLYVAALHSVCEASLPQLSYARNGASVVLSWPAPSCYSIQTATNLNGVGGWNTPAESTVLTNGQNAVTISGTSPSARFFRLAKP